MLIMLIDLLLIATVFTILLTQLIIPLIKDTPMFPIFTRRSKVRLEQEKIEAIAAVEDAVAKKEVDEILNQANLKKPKTKRGHSYPRN